MHADVPPRRRRVEGSFNQGWGIALLVVVLAIVANVVATSIHFRSYTHSAEGGSANMGQRSHANTATHGY